MTVRVGAATITEAGGLSANSFKIVNDLQEVFAGTGSFSASSTVIKALAVGWLPTSVYISRRRNFRRPKPPLYLLTPGSWQGTAIFAGAGGLIASATHTPLGAATEVGAGTLVANATHTPLDAGSDIFAGAGGLAAAATHTPQGASAFAGSGAFATAAGVSSSAVLTGYRHTFVYRSRRRNFFTTSYVNTKFSVGVTTWQDSATFNGSGHFVAVATGGITTWQGSATFNGSGNLVATGVTQPTFYQDSYRVLRLNSRPLKHFFRRKRPQYVVSNTSWQGTAFFTGAGSLVARGIWIDVDFGPELFSGAGGLTTLAEWVDVDFGSEPFVGTGAFVGSATVQSPGPTAWPGSATFIGSGAFSALAYQNWVTNVAVFVGAGVEIANVTHTPVGASTFSGAGAFSAIATEVASSSASFIGSGLFATSANLIAQDNVSFVGNGTLSSAASLNTPATAVLSGAGLLSTISNLIEQIGAIFSGSSSLAAFWGQAPPSANLNAAGSFAASATIIASGTSAFAGSSGLTVNTIQNWASAASFSGSSTLTGTLSQLWTSTASLNGIGALNSQIVGNLVSGSIALGGIGSLSVSVVKNWSSQVTLIGSGEFVSAMLARYSLNSQSSGAGSLQVDAVRVVGNPILPFQPPIITGKTTQPVVIGAGSQ